MDDRVTAPVPKTVGDGEGATTKLCRTCAKPMPAAGLKCTECDSYQDWRRFSTVSAPVLSLLVALIAVLTVALPIAANAFFPNSRMDAKPAGASARHLFAFVSNGGVRPGLVTHAVIWFEREGAHTPWHLAPQLTLHAVGGSHGLVVEPGKIMLVDFALVSADAAWTDPRARVAEGSGKIRCFERVFFQRFDGRQQSRQFEMYCPDAGRIVFAAKPPAAAAD